MSNNKTAVVIEIPQRADPPLKQPSLSAARESWWRFGIIAEMVLAALLVSTANAQTPAAPADCGKTAAACKTIEVGKRAPSGARARPPNLQTFDEVLPPPLIQDDGEVVPRDEVTERRAGGDTITEYRIRGRLYKQRVQPASGAAYTLIDDKGEGKFYRLDGPAPKVAVPMWVLLTW